MLNNPQSTAIHKFAYSEETFESWKDLRTYLYEFEETRLYSGNVFRGHASQEWALEPTLNRIINKPVPSFFERWHIGAEKHSVDRFRLACHHYMSRELLPAEGSSLVEWFSLMQHYGTPTRLLDITVSPFVAAFFALADITSKSETACIWAISVRELDEQNSEILGLGRNYDSLVGRYKQLPFLDVPEEHVVAHYYPERPSQRPFSQKGGFLYTLDNDHDFEQTLAGYQNTRAIVTKLKIKRTRHLVVDSLKDFKIMNISYASLFGGLDGYAKDVATDLFIINS